MKIEDFAKTKEELEIQKKQNDEQGYINENKAVIANANTFGYKGGFALVFSSVFYAFLFIILTSLGVISSGLSIIALIGTSLGMGAIVSELMSRKQKFKEKFKAFSTAKTQIDILEEEVKYQIELEKANNRSKVIEQALTNLDSYESMLKEISSKYDIIDKNTVQTEEETNRKIEKISIFLKEKYNELDLTTTKKVLNNKFRAIRGKFQKISDTLFVFSFSCILSMLYFCLPTLLINPTMSFYFLCASLLVGLGSLGYMSKYYKNRKKVFDRLNSKLGDNALADKVDNIFCEQNELTALIENIITDISVAEINLKEQQRALETIKKEELEQIDNKNLEQSISSYTIDEQKVYEQETQTLLPDELFDEHQNTTQESGPTLVKKLKTNSINIKNKSDGV